MKILEFRFYKSVHYLTVPDPTKSNTAPKRVDRRRTATELGD